MSKTRRGSKSSDHDYWSPRPFNRTGQIPGRFAKRRTHKAERAAEQELIAAELEDLDAENDECCFICGRMHPWEPDEETCENYVIDLLEWGSL